MSVLREQLIAQQEELGAKNEQIGELHVLLQQAQAPLVAVLAIVVKESRVLSKAEDGLAYQEQERTNRIHEKFEGQTHCCDKCRREGVVGSRHNNFGELEVVVTDPLSKGEKVSFRCIDRVGCEERVGLL